MKVLTTGPEEPDLLTKYLFAPLVSGASSPSIPIVLPFSNLFLLEDSACSHHSLSDFTGPQACPVKSPPLLTVSHGAPSKARRGARGQSGGGEEGSAMVTGPRRRPDRSSSCELPCAWSIAPFQGVQACFLTQWENGRSRSLSPLIFLIPVTQTPRKGPH